MKTKNILLTSVLTISLLILFTSLESFKTKKYHHKVVDLPKNDLEVMSPTPMIMYENIEKYSTEYRIPKYIAYNISYLETRYQGPFHWSYNPSQTSCVGALGPMQIMPGTAKLVEDYTVPKHILKTNIQLNIKISMKLLRILYNKYHDWSIVCGCYNTGRPIVNGYARYCVDNYNYQNKWVRLKT